MKYLFEVSWEVCNKVGGIHTVIATKAQEAVNYFGEAYVAIGPDIGQQGHEFKELDDDFFNKVKPKLEELGLRCRFGRWNIKGSPKVVLVGGFKERFNIDRLLYTYWEEYGVDSYGGGWDYIEPVLFSTAAAEVIEQIAKAHFVDYNDYGVAHFHEWMCGAGILYLKKNMPQLGTVFTTHATTLGRALAHHNPYYYKEIEDRHANTMKAHQHGVQSKHSMEKSSAIHSDCFTTVSEITASEAFYVLGKKPDLVVYNGMNMDEEFSANQTLRNETRTKLLDLCSKFLDEKLSSDTKIVIASGRYEYKNKGYDISLEALSRLQANHKRKIPKVLMLFLIAADNRQLENYQLPKSYDPQFKAIGISPVYNADHDPIINATKHFELDRADSKVKVVLSTVYLNGRDGIFNITYEDLLTASDLTLFPSYYEPWGYTPMESVVEGIPTVTSDLAGFGYWSQVSDNDWSDLIKVLPRKNRSYEDALNNLSEIIFEELTKPQNTNRLLEQTKSVRDAVSWKQIFKDYIVAYDIAFGKAQHRSIVNYQTANPFSGARCSIQPGSLDLRCFSLSTALPHGISKLNDVVYNLWWTWDDDAQELFRSINPELWEYFHHNPVLLIKNIPSPKIKELSEDEDFKRRLEHVHSKLMNYMGEISINSIIDLQRPSIAYLSMEFGLHESIHSYSGGLGILAGDHLKAASDLDINLIGIGLFYKNGYFIQEINQDGYQVEHYPPQDWRDLPMDLLLNHSGEPVKIQVEFPDRIVWSRVLLVRVGRIALFMFDTDIDDNHPDDRSISSTLYVGDREARIKQEFLIGVASVRLLKDVLGLNPSIYHLNEGHCAFMAVEQIRRYVQQGYSFSAAIKAIKDSTIFTTHTPVPAGNEAFANDLVERILGKFFSNMNLGLDQFMSLGHNPEKPYEFSMTILAFNIAKKANAVSKLHGDVSKDMWQHILPGEEKFLGAITNGVHMPTWQAREVRKLCSEEYSHEGYKLVPQKINSAENKSLWNAHQEHKRELLAYLHEHIKSEYLRRGLGISKIKQILDTLSEDVLLVGFARRFAPYKRANLLFRDIERLIKIVNDSDKPVIFLFAGKSHPADGKGKEIIQEIYRHVEDERLLGKLLLVENYDMHIGRLLTSGCDVWLNNPMMRKEACGTSGMKAAASGVINLSIPDGWVYEVPVDDIGWKIQPVDSEDENYVLNEESRSIYEMLENQVVPCYYAKNNEGFSPEWTEKMKKSISYVADHFSAKRMLEDYNVKLYMSVIRKGLESAAA
jgi:glycogen phosphorylase/synthase